MDVLTRLELIRNVGEEIITLEELRQLLETNPKPVAYDGFEPSGLAPIHFGIYRAINLKDLIKAGVHFKLFLADWHAWVNNKMGGDLERIRKVGEYFVEVWRAAGIDMSKVELVWASDICSKREYWKKMIIIGKNTTIKRATRALTIMGRKEGEMQEVAQYLYPLMQAADIFELDVDICQLGLDQRRANILAREVAERMKWKRPVAVHHHMLMGLQGKKQAEGFETNAEMDAEISSKMSKSRPESAIFVHDSFNEIKAKIAKAYCSPKDVDNNPMLEYCKYIIFRHFKEMKIERPAKFGGDISFGNYKELEDAFRTGELHPADLKNAVAIYLDKIVEPIRNHFERNKKSRELYEFVRQQEITR
ncbi:MAG: tyrosine--tRNA ligase [Candidatus Aenigmarchaeota archaeon]|nr:tyrosine--tRNA ligase [Candidatus Aenigmarchaeota archaeon]